MRCAREMGMRVLTVHSKIYINCAMMDDFHHSYVIPFFFSTIFCSYFSFRCRILHYYYSTNEGFPEALQALLTYFLGCCLL